MKTIDRQPDCGKGLEAACFAGFSQTLARTWIVSSFSAAVSGDKV